MSRDWGWRAIAASTLVYLAAGSAGAGPSNILNTYSLFAQESIHIRTLTLSGNMGVNLGLLYMRGTVLSQGDMAADLVHMDSGTACHNLFANAVVGPALSSCPKIVGATVPHPIITDLAEECGFQAPATSCSHDPTKDVFVDHDETRVLEPGTYGNLTVEGGGAGPALLKLTGNGLYHFCSVRVGRNGSVRFQAPATVFIDGDSRISNAVAVGPDTSLGNAAPPPGAIKWLVEGAQARFSRHGSISLYACAPNAKMIIGSSTSLTGRFVAKTIRIKKGLVTFAPPFPGVCGDTVISPDEQCEANTDCPNGKVCDGCMCKNPGCTDDQECNPGSPGGGFVCDDGHCVPGCHDDHECNCTQTAGSATGGFVCNGGHCVPGCNSDDDCNCASSSAGGSFICQNGSCVPGCHDDQDCNQGSAGGGFVCDDNHCVPGTTTTTTTTVSASSTTNPSTTTTTLQSCTQQSDCPVGICEDGHCVPQCTTDDDCKALSPTGAFVCVNGRCTGNTEICGDCIDNDGDGLVDFEDPDCCDPQAGQLFDLVLKKGRFRPRATSQTAVRLRGGLAQSGLGAKLDPSTQQVIVQIRSDTGEVLCASIPAGKFIRKHKQLYRFTSKRTPLPVDQGKNLDRIIIKMLKNGQVRFRVKGKRAALSAPAQGRVMITFGFTKPGTTASQNVCSQGVRVFRGGKKGQLTFP